MISVLALPHERVYSLIQVWQLSLHHRETLFGILYVPSSDLVVIEFASFSPPHKLCMRKRNPLLLNLLLK